MERTKLIFAILAVSLEVFSLGKTCPSFCYYCLQSTRRSAYGTIVVCPHQNLTELPIFPNDTISLTLTNNDFQLLEQATFASLPYTANLVEISFFANEIEYIEPGTFEPLRNLQYLDFHINRLEGIEDDTFNGLRNLQVLKLSSNRIQNISVGAFKELGNLKYLTLRENLGLKLYGGIFKELSKLEDLDLNTIDLKFIPNGVFDGLVSLTDLSMRQNKITLLSGGPFQPLSNLRMLWFDRAAIVGTSLKEIGEDAFIGLSNLEDLRLGENDLSYVHPLAFRGLVHLKYLELVRNNLQQLAIDSLEDLVRHHHLDQLYVGTNPWHCNCDLLALVSLLHDVPMTTGSYYGTPTCHSPDNLEGSLLSDLEVLIYYECNNMTYQWQTTESVSTTSHDLSITRFTQTTASVGTMSPDQTSTASLKGDEIGSVISNSLVNTIVSVVISFCMVCVLASLTWLLWYKRHQSRQFELIVTVKENKSAKIHKLNYNI